MSDRNSLGIEIDPVDGAVVFAEGMSRRRWLAAHRDERKAAVKAALLEPPTEEEPDEPKPPKHLRTKRQ
jgi:hypothetical protein